ncbi:MAG: B12-binding domain-containing radical SAM protein [Lachnospiraceae bacterium]|nr:B12-binding domain-containing radical SAM protein [Lachnospiraceae bacterium]
MKYEGTLYRPPSEAYSLIIQVTIGCAHNQCTFCNMYREKKFRVRTKEEIMRDLDECYAVYGTRVRRVFFADGDALVVKTDLLLELLAYVHEKFPYVERISSYGTAKDVLKKSEEDLKALAAAGLELIYIGAESGDDRVLEHIKKDVTAADIIAAGQKLKRCGLKTSVTLISGLGGRKGIREHAVRSAELITGMNPEYASFLTLRLYEGTKMNEEVKRGEMELITPDEIVEEMELFLSHVDSPGTIFRTNHASNYVVLAGTLNEDIPAMMAQLEEAKEEQRYRLEEWRRHI